MIQWKLSTLDHLMISGFGRPFPRHGLQLLFWFANQCVTCEPINFVVVMKVRLRLTIVYYVNARGCFITFPVMRNIVRVQ